MSSVAVSAVLCGVALATFAAVLSPYLAGLTLTVPDRANSAWWRPTRSSRRRVAVTAAVGAVCGLLSGMAAGLTWAGPAFTLLAVLAVPLVVVDVEHHRLPDRLVGLAVVGLGALVLAGVLSGDGGRAVRVVESAASVFVLLAVLTVVARFGFGDTKLGAVLAGYLGWFGWGSVLYGMMAGFLVASVGVIPLLVTRRATMKSAIPFGPAMVLGALCVMAGRGAVG